MSSRHDPGDAAGTDRPTTICDRCDESIPEIRVIHVVAEPCPELTDRYRPVGRTYCPDCAAASGMLEFAVGLRTSPTEAE
ncbi:hypothetical protein [Natrarchaeobius chitinivorans]|uniref:Uncharacterized protein n=1 Tax=Natrarchaeobius chitinivorans TaxID=1679083 RepID=A0A3N6PC95_NATCH|nr:hypothetical protein [Natrarchaeobius chitinivorans]RQG94345.1 hypothetical protein EA473_11585 [Natrarchaeobius chitinivorans]